jgi:hypothetical protein
LRPAHSVPCENAFLQCWNTDSANPLLLEGLGCDYFRFPTSSPAKPGTHTPRPRVFGTVANGFSLQQIPVVMGSLRSHYFMHTSFARRSASMKKASHFKDRSATYIKAFVKPGVI